MLQIPGKDLPYLPIVSQCLIVRRVPHNIVSDQGDKIYSERGSTIADDQGLQSVLCLLEPASTELGELIVEYSEFLRSDFKTLID